MANILSTLLIMNGLFMLLCIPVSLIYGEGDFVSILLSSAITLGVGFSMWFFSRTAKDKELKKRDGYMVVTLGWVLMSVFGALPYLLSGSIPSFTDAIFETISGYSTTGASILTDIEVVHKGILFWRSLTQWIGGMGIIVLAVAILPILGIGGMQLFVAEAPGISPDKLQPRIKETAKRLWYIYLGLTLVETALLWIGGMTFYDAINHAFTTMATGGFSTKNASIAYYTSPFIQYVLIAFMFIAGTNFTISYFFFKGYFRKIASNEEFMYYFLFSVFSSVLVGVTVYFITDLPFERAFRDGMFQVVSVITTTGFVSADYTVWAPFLTLFMFVLMFFGASAGSTAGGVKIVRVVILVKNSVLELKRQLHPSAVIPVRFNKKAITAEITSNILAFIMIYISVFGVGALLIAATGVDFMTSVGAAATCLGNIGPGLGTVGPVDNFSHLPGFAKWVLSFLMLVGRLELFTVLMLFTPYFWSKHR